MLVVGSSTTLSFICQVPSRMKALLSTAWEERREESEVDESLELVLREDTNYNYKYIEISVLLIL